MRSAAKAVLVVVSLAVCVAIIDASLFYHSAHSFSGFRFFAEKHAAPTESPVNVWYLFGLTLLGVLCGECTGTPWRPPSRSPGAISWSRSPVQE
jgi:hypothetical protein